MLGEIYCPGLRVQRRATERAVPHALSVLWLATNGSARCSSNTFRAGKIFESMKNHSASDRKLRGLWKKELRCGSFVVKLSCKVAEF